MGLLKPHVRYGRGNGEIDLTEMETITIFLAIALIIIAVAFLLSWMFRKSIQRDSQIKKLHERHDDELGSGVGTGIGIDKVDGEY